MRGSGLWKLIILVAIILAVTQKVTGSNELIVNFFATAETLIYVALPVIITLGGFYILIKSIFK